MDSADNSAIMTIDLSRGRFRVHKSTLNKMGETAIYSISGQSRRHAYCNTWLRSPTFRRHSQQRAAVSADKALR